MRILLSVPLLALLIAACSSSSSTSPDVNAEGGEAGATTLPSEAGATAEGGAAGTGGSAGALPEGESGAGDTTANGGGAPTGTPCSTATATLNATADSNAPTLQADSFLQRVDSNDAYCVGHGFGKFPDFGPYGYQLSVHYKDAESDAPGTLDAVQAVGAVRIASDPDVAIMTRTDQTHWSLGGSAADGTAIIQLCLDKVYAASDFTVGADVADAAGHRSQAICITQQSGG